MKKKFVYITFAFIALGIVYSCGAAMRIGIPGMIFSLLQSELGWNASQSALISSVGILGCMIFLPLSGFTIDRYGWKKIFPFGILLQFLGGVAIASSTLSSVIYAGAFLNGAGRTIIYLIILKLLSAEFHAKYFSILIGLFYIFSYGGTLTGGAIFSECTSWRIITQELNITTILFGLMAIIIVALSQKNALLYNIKNIKETENIKEKKTSNIENKFFTKKSVWAIFCVSFSIIVYWTFITVGAKKYLCTCFNSNMKPLNLMNTIVMLEMIFAGSISYALGNHRKIFQFLGVGLLLIGLSALAISNTWIGFISIGIGYGLTSVQICALKESVNTSYTARALALANFIANLGIILFSQLIATLYH